MFEISRIPQDREQKLRSLLSDQVDKVIEDFKSNLKTINNEVNVETVEEALQFTLQQDYGPAELNKYYATHPIRVAGYLIDWMKLKKTYSTEAIVAALIHNALEKDILDFDALEKVYGPWTAKTIQTLTQDREAMKIKEENDKYYNQIYQLDSIGQLLKLLDKLDNLYAICLNPNEDVRKNYIGEIRTKVRPLAEKVYPELLSYLDALMDEMLRTGYLKPKLS